MTDLARLISRAEALHERSASLLPPAVAAPGWKASAALRRRKRGGHLEPAAPTSRRCRRPASPCSAD